MNMTPSDPLADPFDHSVRTLRVPDELRGDVRGKVLISLLRPAFLVGLFAALCAAIMFAGRSRYTSSAIPSNASLPISAYNDIQSQLFTDYATELKALDIRRSATDDRRAEMSSLETRLAQEKATNKVVRTRITDSMHSSLS